MNRESTANTTQLLACPECGSESFSWMVRQVQFGNIHEYSNDNRDGEGMKMGPVVDTDLHEEGPFCTECEQHYDMDELVAPDGQ